MHRVALRTAFFTSVVAGIGFLVATWSWGGFPWCLSWGPPVHVPFTDRDPRSQPAITTTDANLHRICLIYSLLDRLDPATPPPTLHALLDIDLDVSPFADGGYAAPLYSDQGQAVQAAVFRHLTAALQSGTRRPTGYADLFVMAAEALTDPSARVLYIERFLIIVADDENNLVRAGWRRKSRDVDVRRRRVRKLRRLCGGLWTGEAED